MSSAETPLPKASRPSRRANLVELLEHGDGLAHIVVGIVLLLLAIGVLVNSTVVLFRELSQVAGSKDFAPTALEYLSSVLLGVIILELLSTILTYIRARSLEATIKDFLVVGLISSVRKILLVGAHSSISGDTPGAFVQEAIGTVISIVGILLLISGLLLLDWRSRLAGAKPIVQADAEEPAAD